MIKTATALLGSQVGFALLRLLRNVLLARLLTVENFGIASTFAVVLALFEMFGQLGFNRQLIQARPAEVSRLQPVLQSLMVARGALAALVLFLTAQPVADFMGVPEAGWAFKLVAIVPLLDGLTHLDQFRMQREMNFRPYITILLSAELATLLAVWPLYLILGDYRVALVVMLLQYIVQLTLSHRLAEIPYRLGLDRATAMRVIRFGAPLLLNLAMVFAIMQGDRLIVANRLGAEALGIFSLAFMLTLMAANTLAATHQNLFLPKLSPLQDDPAAFARMARVSLQLGLVTGLSAALGFALFGADLLLGVFGQKYAAALTIIVWLAVMQAIRCAKGSAAVVALARGETMNGAVANSIRVLLLPVAWYILSRGGDVFIVIWMAILGEMLGVITGYYLLRNWLGISLRRMVLPVLLWVGSLALICLDTFLVPRQPVFLGNFHLFQLVLIAAYIVTVLSMRDLVRWGLAQRGAAVGRAT